MVPSDIGEDLLFYCSKCAKYFREEDVRHPQQNEASGEKKCSQCRGNLEEKRMIEIGHVFKLGIKYSLAQEAFFLDRGGKRKPFIMGCYGIGTSRVLSAIAQVSSDDKGIIWPKKLSPFDISLVVLDEELMKDALDLESALNKAGFSVLVDDRRELAGVKFNDAFLIGNPYILVMGKEYIKHKVIDVEIRKTRQKESFNKEELVNFLKNEYRK